MPEPVNERSNAVNDHQENLKPVDLPVNDRGVAHGDIDPSVAHSDVDLTVVTMAFDAADDAALVAILSKYVVLARMEPGCRNIDLCASVTVSGRYLVIEKWVSPVAQRDHFDGQAMVEMARACTGLLTGPPSIDLLEGISAHDLR